MNGSKRVLAAGGQCGEEGRGRGWRGEGKGGEGE